MNPGPHARYLCTRSTIELCPPESCSVLFWALGPAWMMELSSRSRPLALLGGICRALPRETGWASVSVASSLYRLSTVPHPSWHITLALAGARPEDPSGWNLHIWAQRSLHPRFSLPGVTLPARHTRQCPVRAARAPQPGGLALLRTGDHLSTGWAGWEGRPSEAPWPWLKAAVRARDATSVPVCLLTGAAQAPPGSSVSPRDKW